MFILGATAILVASDVTRTPIEYVFGELATIFFEHFFEIMTTVCFLTLVSLVTWPFIHSRLRTRSKPPAVPMTRLEEIGIARKGPKKNNTVSSPFVEAFLPPDVHAPLNIPGKILNKIPAPSVEARPQNVGILAMDIYFPQRFVEQSDLEVAFGASKGKYTIGLGQKQMGFCDDREDINSMCLNACERLMTKHNIKPEEIGRVEVGTETIVDKSKSTKTVLMQLLLDNHFVEGVTCINACYGGTAALLNAIDWVESRSWDGRYALVVCGDIAVYSEGPARPTGGGSAVAMLVGPDAVLAMSNSTITDRPGANRVTYSEHVWDFFKPDMSSEYPTVDGALSQDCYLRALDGAFSKFASNVRSNVTNQMDGHEFRSETRFGCAADPATVGRSWWGLKDVDFAVFHSPYHKLVERSYARLMFHDYRKAHRQAMLTRKDSPCSVASLSPSPSNEDVFMTAVAQHSANQSQKMNNLFKADANAPPPSQEEEIMAKYVTMTLEKTRSSKELDAAARKMAKGVYKQQVSPGAWVGQTLGNCYTASLYANLVGLVEKQGQNLEGKDLFVFSYGSGLMATAFMLHGRKPTESSRFSLDNFAQNSQLSERIASRTACTPDQFGAALDLRSTFKKVVSNGTPSGSLASITEGNWFLKEINEKSQRLYEKRTDAMLSPAIVAPKSSAVQMAATGRLVAIKPTVEIVISGTSAILPAKSPPFTGLNSKNDTALKRLLAGMNCVEPISEEEQQKIAQINKTVDAATLPKVCARVPDVDLVSEYGLSPRMVRGTSKVTQIAIAAGLESLMSAGLVVPSKNVNGGDAATDWTLKKEHQTTTGIIMCSSFHGMDSTVEAVDLNDDGKAFDKKLVLRLLVGGNAQLAQIVSATGPNTLLNASCASTTQGIGIASDWIRLNRCDRVLVVAAEDVTSKTLLPWIANGFHALGATSPECSAELALRPFDSGRNGLVLSSGAIGLVLEKEPSKKAPSGTIARMIPPSSVQLLGTHYCNAAYHGTSLSEEYITAEMDRFITEIEATYNISRKDIAEHGMYLSHETGTNGSSAKAACAVTEIASLKNVFRSDMSKMLIVNSKGHTGHAMGVSFEDILAVESLRTKQIPVIPHFKTMDSRLNPDEVNLCLDPNADNSHVKYALHFAVGFGSQVAFSLFYSS